MALPPARVAGNMGAPPADPIACADPSVAGCRDYQYSLVQGTNTIYIGRVLRDLNNRAIQYDFRQPVAGDTRADIDNDTTGDIQGTVTLWVRRPIFGDRDADDNNRAILTAEGTAPNYEYAAGTGRAGSMRRLEMTVSLSAMAGVAGDTYGQAGKGSDWSETGDAMSQTSAIK
jgi:hypothetical protein